MLIPQFTGAPSHETVTFPGIRGSPANRQEARRAALAGWSRHGVDTWTVQLAEPDGEPDASQRTGTVTLTVCDQYGRPLPDQADRLRRYLEDHEHLSRNPTPNELETLETATQDGGKLALRRARRSRLVM